MLSLVHILRARALRMPRKRAFTFLADGETPAETLTYADLESRARAIGRFLGHRGAAGERVVLLLPPGLGFVAAFFGCLSARAVAVPAYPPRSARTLPRLIGILEDARPSLVLTTPLLKERVSSQLAETMRLDAVRWALLDEALDAAPGDAGAPPPSLGDLAFLQYTSGSTSTPKGVMVSHGNLIHNGRLIQRACRHGEESVFVSWLPLYHDLGLIGIVLQAVQTGASCVLMAPLAFLQRPLRWLRAVSDYRGTTSGGPNFAYDLCVQRIPAGERATLDLSSWQVAFNGAEPVQADTLDRFAERFAAAGFRREALYPCYGLAEATLMVSGGVPGRAPVVGAFTASRLERHEVDPAAAADPAPARLVGCGRPLEPRGVRIVDPETRLPCADGRVGEIWVSGKSVAAGYWDRRDESAQAFAARLRGAGATAFLRTGDLGFLHDGELFVAGRRKDLIIIRGRNLYPQDIELTVRHSHPALDGLGGAAFSVEIAGQERLVVVQEVETRREDAAALGDIIDAVRRAVVEAHEVRLHELILISAGTLPKTTSGKVQRHACRRGWQEGTLRVVGRSASPPPPEGDALEDLDRAALLLLLPEERLGALETFLRGAAATATHMAAAELPSNSPLSKLGLDSIAALELRAKVEDRFGISPALADLLTEATIEGLAAAILEDLDLPAGPSSAPTCAAGAEGPLSYGQQALWLLHRLDPASAAYNVSGAIRCQTPIAVEVLRHAVQALSDRHPALRTTFGSRGGVPFQRVAERSTADFRLETAAGWSADRLRRTVHEEAALPFDLERGPLLRVRLFAGASTGDVLLLCVHHAVADLWSLAILVSELDALCRQESGGPAAELPALQWRYGDFAAWQRSEMEGGTGERLWAHWREQLAGDLPRLELPTDRPAADPPTCRAVTASAGLGAARVAAVARLGAARGATVFMTLLSAFVALLGRHTGQDDLLVGTPTAGREVPGALGQVGYFVNPVVVRADLAGDPAFAELVGRVRSTVLDAYAHQAYPFPLLAARLQPVRQAGSTPLLQAVFALQKPPSRAGAGLAAAALGVAGVQWQLGGHRVESLALPPVAPFELTLAAAELEGDLHLAIVFQADRFDAVTARRWLDRLLNLIGGAIAEPQARVFDLPLLSQAERYQATWAWNETAPVRPEMPEQVHRRVMQQTRLRPDAVAVVGAGGAAVTYGELGRRAGDLAAVMVRRGIGAEDRVGILLERSPEAAIAALATLLAGAAYLPLDPAYPGERLAYMLQDAAVAVVLTCSPLAPRLAGTQAVPLLLEDGAPDCTAPAPAPSRRGTVGAASPQSLAYVIYTSGSTGRPKGAQLIHAGLANLVDWHLRQYRLSAEDRTTLLAGPGFDAAVWELWPALAAGASVHVVPEDRIAAPSHLAAWLAARGITHAFVPTPLAEALLAERLSELRLRHLLTGGDLLHRRPPASAGFSLVNHYGPTEATVVATSAEVAPGDASCTPPIGRPIDNVRAWVVSGRGSLVPLGTAGELWLGGGGLGRGYLGRPELTAERFVPDPFSTEPGARCYRTGDSVRRLPNGDLDFVGRIDQQVKVRGVRVELGEIEALLAAQPGVAEAALVAWPDAARGTRLAAYWVRSDRGANTDALRAALRRKLPEPMVPAAFVELTAMPLTAHGKVNRRALPEPGWKAGEDFIEPRSPTEEILAGIWAEVLGIERVGSDDEFFALGGHSLLAAQVASRVGEAFGVDLPLARFFTAPTVTGLASEIDSARFAGGAAPWPRLAPTARDAPLPLSFAQETLWLQAHLEPDSPAYNVAGGLRLRGALETQALAAAVAEIVRRHEALRTVFAASPHGPTQRCLPMAATALPLVDLAGVATAPTAALRQARGLARRPFDLARGPLCRAVLFRLGADDHLLALVLHHIAADGWSVGILARELEAIYTAACCHQPAGLAPLSIQYADFAAWQRSWLRGEALASRLASRLDRLRGAPLAIELPADRPRPAVRTRRGFALPVALPAAQVDELRRLGRGGQGLTLFMTIAAAFCAFVGRHSERDDLLIGAPIAGRERREIEGLIGCFVNTLVLRARLDGDPTFVDLLGRLRGAVLEAFEVPDLPFEQLVEELRPARDASRSPVVQAVFALQRSPPAPPRLPGLAVDLVEIDTGTSKFDLSLSLGEAADGALRGRLELSSDLFTAPAAGRLWQRFAVLLAAAGAAPRVRLSELPLLTGAERHQLLLAWNDTAREGPGEPVHRRVADRARRDPAAVAVVACDGRELTYGELHERATALAAFLVRAGVRPERRVAILLQRSPETAVAALAVLAAGGAYLPLDPAYPAERLAYMLEDSGAALLLTRSELAERVDLPPWRLVCLDRLDPAAAPAGRIEPAPQGAPAAGPPLPTVAPEGLAYLIYTSGTTGRPKGTELTHRGLSGLVEWHLRRYQISPGERLSLLAGPGFDAAVWELWPALTAGARLHVPPPEVVASPPLLADWLARCEITRCFLPTPLAEALLAGPLDGLRLRHLLTGGDRLRRRPPADAAFSLVNHYGPTETTVVATAATVPSDDEDGETSERLAPAIGRPIDNALAWVVDRHGNLAPPGVAGELWIGGAGVARGYHGQPEMTAERFLPDPFSGEHGARCYRTGDLARHLAAGDLDFLGRIDRQVQIRGFRVEPGEIESVLARLPGVREAAVVARSAQRGEARLVAYWAGEDPQVTAESLRAALRRALPEPMVPATLVRLAALPLTAHGKLDRRALPPPAEEMREPAALASPAEEMLAGIWSEVLGIERVGADDNFLALGGHSLLASRVTSRVHAACGVELPLRRLFEPLTLRELAVELFAAAGHTTSAAAHATATESAVGAGAPPLTPVPRDGDLPLSFAQQRLWFLTRLEPDSPFYNLPAAFRLRGALDPRALDEALNHLVRRHEVLRTVFLERDGRAVQRVRRHQPRPTLRVDLSTLPAPVRERELHCLAAATACRAFDVAAAPLLCAALVHLGKGDHALLVTLHHLIADGWSMGILARELAALYAGSLAGARCLLPDPAVQYGDFAVWQGRWLADGVVDAQLAFWRRRLAGAASLDLPTDFPRPPVQSLRGANERFVLARELCRSLDELGRREGATLFMTLLTAFGALLSRYSGQPDLVIGSPVAARSPAAVEELIGLFANTLALRLDLSGEPSFRAALARSRATCLDAYAHQDAPFDRVVEALHPERDLSRTPVFQVLLTLDPPLPPLALRGVACSRLETAGTTSRFDLALALAEADGELAAQLEFCLDLFDPATAHRLAAHLRVLLEGIAADPGQPISELSLMAEAERHQVVTGWNQTARPSPDGLLLHDLVFLQAARTPQAVALVDGLHRLTYGELRRRAEALARRLRCRAVGPEVVVGLYAERSPDLVVGALAVLAAGGAYAPLDPMWPDARLALVLEDLGAPVVLTEAPLLPRLQAAGAHPLAVLLADDAAADDAPPPDCGAQAGNLAYVLHTSGSTGRPKGVAVEHRSAVALVSWASNAFAAADLQGVLFSTSICFDLSVFEMFVPLSTGGKVLLARNALDLAGLPAASEVTLVNTVPGAMAELVAMGKLPASVRLVCLAGEVLRGNLVTAVEALGPAVLNLYGPTEDTTYSTWARVDRRRDRRPAPIGRPIANTRAYIVDRGLRPVPIDVPGELWLAGSGLTRGYRQRPDLTAERFVPDPFAAAPGERAYRTGDLCRFRGDGEIDFLGRIDQQVKLRGFRIEPGEIEAALATQPGVKEAAVILRHDCGPAPALVAYVAATGGVALSPAGLRHALGVRLPAHMVPSAFVRLDALPRTSNGKLDRRSLPAPPRAAAGEQSPAHSPAEELLAILCAGVLDLDRVGTHDNFFALGGQSLLAIRLVSRIRDSLGLELPVRAVFQHPTPATLARHLSSLGGGTAVPPPIERAARDADLPLSFAQQRLWLLSQMDAASPVYNLPAGLRLRGTLDRAALRAACGTVMRRHEVLRTTVEARQGRPVQRIGDPFVPALPLIDLGNLPAEQREVAALGVAGTVARLPFDLAHGPVLRLALLRLAPADHLFLCSLHHIACDAWSLGVLLHELAAAYGTPHGAPSLAALPFQYADYAAWQRRWLAGGTLDSQLAYWRERLAGAPVLELPSDRPRPRAQSFRGRLASRRWPPGLTARIAAACARQAVTPFMVLLASFAALLARYSGQRTLSIGTPTAGRTRSELEGLIGLFVNTLVLRLDVPADRSFGDLLRHVRETALGAYAHQDLPFERLVEELRPERNLGRTPLFNVLLAHESVARRCPQLPGLTTERVEPDTGTAKFDLTLFAVETAGGLRTTLEFATDLFDPPTATRLLGHLCNLLTGALADLRLRLDDLSLLAPGERAQILEAWSESARELPPAACFHQLFAAQVERTPQAEALRFGGTRWTYRQLAERAGRLAARLRALGIGPETVAAVCLERSPQMIVSLLAVLQAGGAYVPLDPGYPAERLAFMLEDSAACLLIGERAVSDRLPAHALPTIWIDDEAAAAGQSPAPLPGAAGSAGSPETAGAALPDNLAYVLYTSGSTGTPKAVAVRHRGLAALSAWAAAAYTPAELAGMLASTSICFDLSVFELLVPLTLGGRVVLVRDVMELSLLAGTSEVTLVNTVPSAMTEILRRGGLPASVRTVNLAGEPLPRRLAAALYATGTVERVFNLYGPSEDTTYSTGALVAAHGHEPPSIGRPLPGTRLHILDRGGRPQPAGVPGELCIGGAGLARGYLARPALTAERFVPDPFGDRPGGRLYRSGDLCRWRPDGEIEFLGRLDTQVKIRGHRVELGEVEAALLHSPSVREAVVTVRELGAAGPCLVAYLSAAPGPPPELDALRDAMRERLPLYMIPAAFVALRELPRLPNGKVDRVALPAPGADRLVSAAPRVAPASAVEQRIAALWSEVLGLDSDRIGVEDDFFALGGHSLLAAQLLFRIHEEMAVQIALPQLFDNPTIAGLAAAVERSRTASAGRPEPALRAIPRERFRRRLAAAEMEPAGGAALASRDLP